MIESENARLSTCGEREREYTNDKGNRQLDGFLTAIASCVKGTRLIYAAKAKAAVVPSALMTWFKPWRRPWHWPSLLLVSVEVNYSGGECWHWINCWRFVSLERQDRIRSIQNLYLQSQGWTSTLHNYGDRKVYCQQCTMGEELDIWTPSPLLGDIFLTIAVQRELVVRRSLGFDSPLFGLMTSGEKILQAECILKFLICDS